MDPVNLSGMLDTPAENWANLDAEYQDKIWRLPEKFPIQKKCMSLKMMERKLWQARLCGLKICFIFRQRTVEYNAIGMYLVLARNIHVVILVADIKNLDVS